MRTPTQNSEPWAWGLAIGLSLLWLAIAIWQYGNP